MTGQAAQVLTCMLAAAVGFATITALPVQAEGGPHGRCQDDQCLVMDFIQNRNNRAHDPALAVRAYGDFLSEDRYGLAGAGADLCAIVPSTACFVRTVALRQKIYLAAGRSEPIGCLVVGGIWKDDLAYRSYGIVYEHGDHGWRPVAINYLVSLNDMPSASDLLEDPCPARAKGRDDVPNAGPSDPTGLNP